MVSPKQILHELAKGRKETPKTQSVFRTTRVNLKTGL
jgi:hypothetical protein